MKIWIWPLLIYAVHSLFFTDWLVDDAGITYVYARNWAEGYGLVSQPGAIPIEGYSNFSWVVILAIFMKAGMFHPYWIPKLLALGLSGGSFYLLEKGLKRDLNLGSVEILFALSLIAINSSYVAMANCGLENSLYTFLGVLLWERISKGGQSSNTPILAWGMLIALLGLTRPEGLLFGAMLLLPLLNKQSNIVKMVSLTFAGFVMVYGSYLLFRINYFGEWLPAPFYIKGSSLGEDLFSISKWHHLFRSVSGPLGGILFVAMTGLSVYLIWTKAWKASMTPLALIFLLSCLVFVILPYDGLWWYRYATPFLVFFYPFFIVLVHQWLQKTYWEKLSQLPKWKKAGALIFLLATLAMSIYTTRRLVRNPVVPFSQVAAHYGKAFNQLADSLDWETGSVLLPDVGGTLYYSRLKVHDLAGLTDAAMCKLYRYYPEKLHDYVFDTIQPDIIQVHGMWALETRFDLDERFQRDYVGWKAGMDTLVLDANGDSLLSGTFVRRERISGSLPDG